jgi:hypothetical protein
MSRKLFDRSPDLKRLRDEGYDLGFVGTHLLVGQVPYVNAAKEVKRGTLVCALSIHEDATTKPPHEAFWIGDKPCDAAGRPLEFVSDSSYVISPELTAQFTFSSKPTHGRGYADHHEKMTTYVKILLHQAQVIEPGAKATVFPRIGPDPEETVFKYFDSASSRAGIEDMAFKLARDNIAIIGLGGTGSYILDQVAKTRVKQIHLFDDDWFYQHNAFRSPGAVAFEEFRPKFRKVDHYCSVYSKLRHGVVPHPYRVTEANVHELQSMNFVFISIDRGDAKVPIISALEGAGISFIDVGMGVHRSNAGLFGILRVTTGCSSIPDARRAGINGAAKC